MLVSEELVITQLQRRVTWSRLALALSF